MAKKGWRNPKWYLSHRENENGIIERQCSKCKEWLEENTDNFYPHNKQKLEKGYQAECKICSVERGIKYQKEHSKERSEYNKNRRLNNPNYFRQNMLRYYADNKEMYNKYTREWRKNNPDKVKSYSHNWQMHKLHKINKQEIDALYKYANYSCMYCGMTEEESKKQFNKKLYRDHFVNEGDNTIDNCILCCANCSSSKRDMVFEEWYTPNNPRYSVERLDKIYKWINEDWKLYYIEKKPRAPYGSKKKTL